MIFLDEGEKPMIPDKGRNRAWQVIGPCNQEQFGTYHLYGDTPVRSERRRVLPGRQDFTSHRPAQSWTKRKHLAEKIATELSRGSRRQTALPFRKNGHRTK